MSVSAILRQWRGRHLCPILVTGVGVACAALAGSAGGAASSSHASALSFKLDHFLCYTVEPAQTFKPRGVVVLDPQFKPRRKTAVLRPETLCNWASKNRGRVLDKRRHLLCYTTRSSQAFRPRQAIVTNQFKSVRLAVVRPNVLCLPSGKSLERVPVTPPKTLDHFQCYPVKTLSRVPRRTVLVGDEFGSGKYLLGLPIRLCDPASKNNSPIVNKRDHLLCYLAKAAKPPGSRPVYVTNQFGRAFPYRTVVPRLLCVPSLKRLVPLRPDLTVKIDQASLAVTCPGGAAPCTTAFKFTVTNIGAAASGGFDIAATATPGQTPNPPIPPQSGLAAGASRTLSVSFGPDGNCFASGGCTVTVTVDSGNVVAESNESNNTDSFTKPG
jgi:CARDB